MKKKVSYLLIFGLLFLLLFASCIRQQTPLTISVTKAVTGINGVVPVKSPVDIKWSVAGVDSFTAKVVVKFGNSIVFEKSGSNLTEVTIPEDKFVNLGDYTYYVEVTAGDQTVKTKDLTFKVVPSVKEVKILSQNNTSVLKDTSKNVSWDILSYIDGREYEYKIMLKSPGETEFTLVGTTTNKTYEITDLATIGTYSMKIVAVELNNIEVESPEFLFQVANSLYDGENHFPEIGNSSPENNAINVAWEYSTFDTNAIVKLSWMATDVDNDALEFDVYIDDSFIATTENTEIQFEGFLPEENISWYVVARDEKGFETKSPVWSFTLKSNTAPVFETDVASEIVNDSVVRFSWDAIDNDNDELKYEIYSGTQEASTLIDEKYANFFNTENKDGNYIIVAKDPFGGITEKEFIYTAPTSEITGNATVVVYVTDAKSGPAVAEATVTVNGIIAKTDSIGMATITLNLTSDSTLLTIEATKLNHALTKVDGLMLKVGEVKDVYITLRKAELNPDPDTQELPEVDFHVYKYNDYYLWATNGATPENKPEALDIDNVVINYPIFVEVTATPVSNDHINIIYAALGKTPGSGFMTGDRGYTSGATEVAFAFNTFDYNGLTDLHITVYDYNDNQIEIVKYLNILNNNDIVLPKYTPADWASHGMGTNLDSYTRRMEIGFYSQGSNIEKANVKINNLIKRNVENKIKLFESKFNKKLDYNIEAAQPNSNLWVEVWWIPVNLYPDGVLYQYPNGYNIYRSFDGMNWEKAGYVSQYSKNNFIFRDYSPKLEPGKEVHYGVTAVYDDGETTLHYLGSVIPLGMFDVELTSPSMLSTNVAREPIFEFRPKVYDNSLDNATFSYALWIYDLVQSEQHLVPIYFGEDGNVYQQKYDVVGPYSLAVNYADQQWALLSAYGASLYNEPLVPNKTYSWAIDLAYAYTQNDVSSAISISIDQGYGVDPLFGRVDADAFNTFTTGTHLTDVVSIADAQNAFVAGDKVKYIIGSVVDAYSNYVYLEDPITNKALKLKFDSNVYNVNIGDILIVKGDMYSDTFGKTFAVKNVEILFQESGNELNAIPLDPSILEENNIGLNPYASALVSSSGTITNIDENGLSLEYDTTDSTASIYVYKGGSNILTSDATIGDRLDVKGILKYYKTYWEISLRSDDDWSKQ
ncbi:hypothetical protein SAMN02745164_01609 [Marinitoga hydrogenitolerans DSM 16785]|uniref:Fibronectin type-III domain-containing protein n=1 Tax=Marinitoga hydrogenitolerans (strain DSM 16785 / JCM 12826 / AT1271) TaxID=1122195 RepID=A0A1M4Y6U4_MARH1|nr:hypothetical protein [Marinitoga hydrogenitolerans]SHF01428.1 hypothetical protein SAMN02745164_01609 [Marinitoga hydrogenitolerans DSM 16785]